MKLVRIETAAGVGIYVNPYAVAYLRPAPDNPNLTWAYIGDQIHILRLKLEEAVTLLQHD